MSTICAVSTPQGAGGISVIRISGENAIAVAEKIFQPFGGKKVTEMAGHTCVYGKVVSGGEIIDDALLTVFVAPKSFTGENTAEISCHGGIYVTKRVLRACLENGAELAAAGEFTKRAFLNGKLSLTQAESVIETIKASGEQTLRSANLTREGRLFAKIKTVCDRLVSLLSQLAAWNDYPDEDIPEVEESAINGTLSDSLKVLDEILQGYDRGRIFRHGIDTAIVGRPNVGKSTLMNMLLGYDRSIVTSVAGTTRDIVEESAVVGDVTLRLSDTAGIHDTGDEVEKIGVTLAKEKLENSDLVLCVLDGSQPLNADDKALLATLPPPKTVVVINKSDLGSADISADLLGFEYTAEISAKNGVGLSEIEQALEKIFRINSFDENSMLFANERQKACTELAKSYLSQASQALAFGETLDAVTIMIDKATEALLELTGEKITEAVVDKVFESFCVGK